MPRTVFLAARLWLLLNAHAASHYSAWPFRYIIEDAIRSGTGGSCNIICTQPRRISAIGVAERVASERGESIGKTVGYQIRLESKMSAQTRLSFVTTGILLRRLQRDPNLEAVSHLVIDEIHERGVLVDFLLCGHCEP